MGKLTWEGANIIHGLPLFWLHHYSVCVFCWTLKDVKLLSELSSFIKFRHNGILES